MGAAERYDVVCNFANYANKTLYFINGRDEKQMKAVPYFCYSHLVAKILVAATVTTPTSQFNPAVPAPKPVVISDQVLNASVYAQARAMVAQGKSTRQFVFGR